MRRQVEAALRASVTWDDDRRLDAIKLASGLGKRPESVVAGLRESYHGCEWLANRWALLAHAADSQDGSWTAEQASLAFDLLGTPVEFREGHAPGTTIGRDGKLEGVARPRRRWPAGLSPSWTDGWTSSGRSTRRPASGPRWSCRTTTRRSVGFGDTRRSSTVG